MGCTYGAFGANDFFSLSNAPGTGFTQTGLFWNTTNETFGPLAAFTSGNVMIFGTNVNDFYGSNYTVNLDGNNNMNNITIGATNTVITLIGTQNTHLSAASTWSVAAGSILNEGDTRHNGLNMNNEALTFTGGGTINFQTPMGANDTGTITENMIGGTVNFQQTADVSGQIGFTGKFILTNGTMNFATAQAAGQVFDVTTNGVFSLNGGTLDNTSGSPQTLVMGPGAIYSLGGNFTFAGSSSLDFGFKNNVTNTGNRTVTLNANTLSIGGVISGPGNGLTKLGAGTLLLYGNNTYSGGTIVGAGTLAITNGGSITNSPLTVTNATLDLSGLNTAITLAGLSASNSTLVVSGFVTTATNIMTATLNPGGTTNIVNILSLPPVTTYPSTFHIIKAVGVVGTLNFGLGTLPGSPAFTGFISNNVVNNTVDLVISGGPVLGNFLTWSGTNATTGLPDGTWDVANTPTWLNAGVGVVFDEGDFVTFDDTVVGQTVISLSGGLQPGTLTVTNAAKSYTFTGGSISDSSSGPLTLNKQGSGTLLLQESGDTFTGGINVGGGTLIIDNDSSGINGGATVASGGTIQVGINDTAGVLPTGTITDNGTLLFSRADDITVVSGIAGTGTVEQFNTNIVTLSGTGSGNWTALITNGTLQVANNTSLGSLPGGAVTITNGGTLDLGGNVNQNTANYGAKQFNIAGAGVGGNGAIVNSATVQQQDAFQNIVLTADATIGGPSRWDIRGGTPVLDLAGHTLTKTNANQTSMVSPHVTSGNIIIQQGTLSFEATPSFDASAGTIAVNSGGFAGQFKVLVGNFTRSIVLNGGGTTNLSGAGSVCFLDAPILLTANSTIGSPSGTEFFDNVISDGGNGFSLTDMGLGTNLLAATNTYSGNTIVTLGTLGLTNQGSIANSPVIVVTNGATFDVSGLSIPFTGGNALILGDDVQGTGKFNVGKTIVTNLNSISISNATISLAVVNANIPNITVTNLNLGDSLVGSTINITALPATVGLIQFPLIKYSNAIGTYNLSLGTLPAGFSANLLNNTLNKSIDLQITAIPPGTWNGGDAPANNNWSDALNWSATALSGNDALTFTGSAGLNNTNDTGEAASSITFAPGAGAFILNGNAVTLGGDINNNSSNPQTINLAQTLNTTPTNYNFNGGSSGLTINGSLTGSAVSNGMEQVALIGNAVIDNVISSGIADAGLRLNVTNTSDGFGLNLGGNNTSSFGGQLFVSRGVMNYGSATETPNMTMTRVTGGNIGEFLTVGETTNGIATFNMKNGSLTLNDGQGGAGTTSVRLALGNAAAATGPSQTANWNQTGGTLTLQGFDVGSSPGVFGANNPGNTTAFNISAGTFDTGDAPVMAAVRGVGSLNISGTGTVRSTGTGTNASGAVTGVTINDDRMVAGNLQSVGTLNLNAGGTLLATSIRMTADRGGVSVNANMNFNGGVWRFNANGANLFAAGVNGGIFVSGANYTNNDILAVTVQSGGAVIDNNGVTGAINMPLLHDATLGIAPDGGLNVKGSGIVTLTGANTYTGNTIVGSGTLALSGSGSVDNSANLIISNLATIDVTARTNSTLTLANSQILKTATNGTVAGNLTNSAGSSVSPGGSGTLGVLNVSGNVALLGTVVMDISRTAIITNDLISSGASMTFGGVLNVSLVTGAPALGDTFQLFNAASFNGNFSSTSLPALGAGLAWNWNPANGSLSVVSAGGPGTFTQPTGITSFHLNGANVVLTATNGQAGDAYYLLQSTNLNLPLGQWRTVATNVPGANGTFTFIGTNVFAPANSRQFYILGNTNFNP